MDDLARLLAHEAIGNTLARYCLAVDDGDAAAVAAVFTDDGELDVGHGIVIAGRSRLLEFFTTRLANYGASSHHLSNVRIRVEGAHAVTGSYVYARVWLRGDDGDGGELWGRYDDILLESDGAWLIQHRRLRAANWRGFPSFPNQPVVFERYRP